MSDEPIIRDEDEAREIATQLRIRADQIRDGSTLLEVAQRIEEEWDIDIPTGRGK